MTVLGLATSPEFWFVAATLALMNKMGLLLSLPYKPLAGLLIWLPPSDEEINKLAPPLNGVQGKKRKKLLKGKRTSFAGVRGSPIVPDQNQLSTLPMWGAYDLLMLLGTLCLLTLLFDDVSGCLYARQAAAAGPSVAGGSLVIGMLLLVLLYAVYVVLRTITQAGLCSTEIRISLCVGLVSGVMTWAVLAYGLNYLDFDLKEDLKLFNVNLVAMLKKHKVANPTVRVPWVLYQLVLITCTSVLSASTTFAAKRCARCYYGLTEHTSAKDPSPVKSWQRGLCHINFCMPLLVAALWCPAGTRDVLFPARSGDGVRHVDPLYVEYSQQMFARLRLYVLVAALGLRLYAYRLHVKAFLDEGLHLFEYVDGEQLDTRVGRMVAENFSVIVTYIPTMCIQYIGPFFVMALLTAAYKERAKSLNWGVCSILFDSPNPSSSPEPSPLAGTLAFLLFWFNVLWFTQSLVALIYTRRTQHVKLS